METAPIFGSEGLMPRQRRRNTHKHPSFQTCGFQASATQTRTFVAGQVASPLIQAFQIDGLSSNAHTVDHPSYQRSPRRKPRRSAAPQQRWSPYAVTSYGSGHSYEDYTALSVTEMNRQRGSSASSVVPGTVSFGTAFSPELSFTNAWDGLSSAICRPCCHPAQPMFPVGEATYSEHPALGGAETIEEKYMPASLVVTQPYITPELIGASFFNPSDVTDTTRLLSQDPVPFNLPPQCQELAPVASHQVDLEPSAFFTAEGTGFSSITAPMEPFMLPVTPQIPNYVNVHTQQLPSSRLGSEYVDQPDMRRPIDVSLQPLSFEGLPAQFDIVQSNQKGGKRGPFKEQRLREQTAFTRKWGACGRCKMQRIRCNFDNDDPYGACGKCRSRTKPNPEQLFCFRSNLTDIRLYKPGQVPGYEWTRRWNSNTQNDIDIWASDTTKTIWISEGFSGTYMECRVKRFVPQQGDKLVRSWVCDGVSRSVPIPPYALERLGEVKQAYEKHMVASERGAISHVVGSSSPLLRKTYEFAAKLRSNPDLSPEARDVLGLTFKLWMAIRFSTRSTWIVGRETLGMLHTILDGTSPDPGKIPLPPVLGAQLDNVLIHDIQTQVRHDLLTKLQHMLQHSRHKNWLVIYLVTFMLLHNAALVIKHDASYARKHGINRRFAREDKVLEYHHGANTLLWYFRYTNKHHHPFSNACKDEDLRSIAELSDEQILFVKQTRVFISMQEAEWAQVRREGRYEDSFYYVSQIYETKWQAEPCHITSVDEVR